MMDSALTDRPSVRVGWLNGFQSVADLKPLGLYNTRKISRHVVGACQIGPLAKPRRIEVVGDMPLAERKDEIYIFGHKLQGGRV